MKKVIGLILFFLFVFSLPLQAGYKQTLRKWTRHDRVFSVDNFEARLIWSATLLSPQMREALRTEKVKRYLWSSDEIRKSEIEDENESSRYDVFLVGIYAGSSNFPEVGKNEGNWRFRLDSSNNESVDAASIDRIPITQVERELFPYLDKWTEFYRVKFPKGNGHKSSVQLIIAGLPAKAHLEWTIHTK